MIPVAQYSNCCITIVRTGLQVVWSTGLSMRGRLETGAGGPRGTWGWGRGREELESKFPTLRGSLSQDSGVRDQVPKAKLSSQNSESRCRVDRVRREKTKEHKIQKGFYYFYYYYKHIKHLKPYPFLFDPYINHHLPSPNTIFPFLSFSSPPPRPTLPSSFIPFSTLKVSTD